jgi:hypothetical protein
MYENSANPAKLIVGLCIQNDDGDEPCFLKNPALAPYKNNIRTINLSHYEAKGPTWARYLCTTLMQNEDYFLQVDSHTLFDKDWDAKLISMVADIKANTSSKDVVLSHYPPLYEDYGNPNRDKKTVDTICQSFFNERGMVSFLGAEGVDMKKHKYVQTPHIAAGMFFCEGKCIKEVPYDPHLPNLFVGEEILHSARVWTAGYDIYTPQEIVVYHLYTRADQPHVWDDKKDYNDEDAFNKAKMILGFENNLDEKVPKHVKANIDKYGLGKKRSLKQFFDFAGIDAENKRIRKNFCPQYNGKVKSDESHLAKLEREYREKQSGGAGGKQENFKEKLSEKELEKELEKAQKEEEQDADKYADVDPLPEPENAEVVTTPEVSGATGGRESFTGMGAKNGAVGVSNWLWNILFKGFWIFLIFLACVVAYEPRLRFYYSNLFGGGGGNGKSRIAEFFGRGKK